MKVLFPYVFLGTQMTWSKSWSQLVLDITWEQMNRKIGWVGDVIGLNFLRVLFENGFLERRVLTDLLISDGTLFRNVCEPSMLNDSWKGRNLPTRQLSHRQFPIGWLLTVATGSDHLSWVTPWKKIEQGHCVPYANTVEHINELKGRLEINF